MVRQKFHKKEIMLGIFSIVIALFFLTVYIGHQVESVRLGYNKGKLEGEILSLQKDIEKLEAEKSFLFDLQRVEKIAAEQLKMQAPTKDQIVYSDFDPKL